MNGDELFYIIEDGTNRRILIKDEGIPLIVDNNNIDRHVNRFSSMVRPEGKVFKKVKYVRISVNDYEKQFTKEES